MAGTGRDGVGAARRRVAFGLAGLAGLAGFAGALAVLVSTSGGGSGVTATLELRRDTAVPLAPSGAAPLDRLALDGTLADDPIAAAQRDKRIRRASDRGGAPGSRQRDLVPLPVAAGDGRDRAVQVARPIGAGPRTAAIAGLGTTLGAPAGANGAAAAGTRYTPPDADGDAGSDHYVQIVNASLAVFDRTSGALVAGPMPSSALWAGFGGPCEDEHADGIVRWDELARRWVVGRPTVGRKEPPHLYCVAVSATADPTGAWHRYAFEHDLIPDFAKLAVWPDGYYVTVNRFDAEGRFAGSAVCAIEREAMLDGRVARQQCAAVTWGYHSLLAADLDGTATPPPGTPAQLLALGLTTDSLAHWTFAVDWADPTRTRLSVPAAIPVPPYALPCGTGGACVPQPGTATLLDAMGDRLSSRVAFRALDDRGRLLAGHAVAAGDGSGGTVRTAVRWYELDLLPGERTPRIAGVSTFAPDARHRWLPVIAADRAGNVALGYAIGDATLRPSLAVAGRLAADPPGSVTRAETVAVEGQGSQTTLAGLSITRWGDYASLVVDPVDGCTFVLTGEHLPGDGVFNWATSIVRFRLPGCVPADGSPDPTAPTVAGASVWGSGTGNGTGSGGESGPPPAAGGTTAPSDGAVAGVVCGPACPDGSAGAAVADAAGTVASISPRRGGPGTTVTIVGQGLDRATAVWFAGYRSPRIVALSPTRLLAAVPRGAPTGRVVVRFGEAAATAAARFVVAGRPVPPTVRSVSVWRAAPGSTVTIRGVDLAGVAAVRFGGVAARSLRLLDASRLLVVVPPGARSGPLVVVGAGGSWTSGRRFVVAR
ncbi:MAG: hypothetical protein RL338_228 [Chloroflexota bacterium]